MNDQAPEGQRYSQIYIERGEALGDSPRFRKRLYATQTRVPSLGDRLTRELGIDVGYGDYSHEIFESFFKNAELRDILDYVTIAAKIQGSQAKKGWLGLIQRIMDEEHIAFRVDDEGGVHPRVDLAFGRSMVLAVDALNGARYRNVSAQFEQAENALSSMAPDPKHGIRSIFSAVEGLFRLMFPSAPRLGAKELRDHLTARLDDSYKGDITARRSAAKTQDSLSQWIDSAHFYRHEPGQEEPAQPPMELAVLLIAQGTDFLRWLATLDRKGE